MLRADTFRAAGEVTFFCFHAVGGLPVLIKDRIITGFLRWLNFQKQTSKTLRFLFEGGFLVLNIVYLSLEVLLFSIVDEFFCQKLVVSSFYL